MSTVLVTGANGFIGRALCPVLTQAGHTVRAAVRTPERIDHLPSDATGQMAPVVVGDLGPDTDWRAPLAGADAVVHLAARVHRTGRRAAHEEDIFRCVNVGATEALAQAAARAGVSRFVFLSTVKVHGESSPARPLREDDPAAPSDPYARSKWRAEQSLATLAEQSDLPVTILRPALVCGPGAKGNLLRALRWLARGRPVPVCVPPGKRSLAGLSNLVGLIRVSLDHPGATSRTFLVADDPPMSPQALFTRMSAELGVHPRLLPLPKGLLRLAASIVRRRGLADRLCGSLQVDAHQVRSVLGWQPRLSLDAEIARMAQWYRGSQTVAEAPH